MCSWGARQAYTNCKDRCLLPIQLWNSGSGLEPNWLEKRQACVDVPLFLSRCPPLWKHCPWQIWAHSVWKGIKLPSQSALPTFPVSLSNHFHSYADQQQAGSPHVPFLFSVFLFLLAVPSLHLTSTSLLRVTGEVSLLKESLMVTTSKKFLLLSPWAKGTFSTIPSHPSTL